MKLEKQACMLALAAILLLIVGAFVVGFPAGATLAEETDIDLNAFEGSVILDDPVYFQEATPDEPEVKPTQQPTTEPTRAPANSQQLSQRMNRPQNRRRTRNSPCRSRRRPVGATRLRHRRAWTSRTRTERASSR